MAETCHDHSVICPEPSTLQELVQGLHRRAAPWLASGLGTRLDWASPVLPAPGEEGPLVISTCKLDQVVEHRAGDFTVTVQAGHPLVALQAMLAEAGQWLPVDWPWGSGRDGEQSGSVGGLVARGLAGGLRQRHLGVRDQVIGIKVMRTDGTIAKAGGQVVKNVAGYDLMRLMTGSWGSLGLITEVTLRTLPKPRCRAGLVMVGKTEQLEILRQQCLAGGLPPQRLDWWSTALNGQMQPALLLALSSISPAALEDQLNQTIHASNSLAIKVQRLDSEQLVQQESRGWSLPDPVDATTQHWLLEVGVLPSKARDLLEVIDRLGLHCTLAAGQGQGLAWSVDRKLAAHHVDQLRQHCRKLGGDLTVLKQPQDGGESLPSWSPAAAEPWIKAIKREFDPLQQLGRGRLPGVQL